MTAWQLNRNMKILIGGYSGTGKTTLGKQLAEEHDIPLYQTDSLLHLPRPKQLTQIASWLDQDEYVIEGTQAGAGLREWKRTHPFKPPPIDKYIVLTKAKRLQTQGQQRQKKGLDTIERQLRHWIKDVVEYEDSAPAFERERELWEFD